MIYLDNNATTPVLPEVFEAMRPYLCEQWGNPSSSYRFGSTIRTVVETAREQVAALIGAYTPEVLFTGCATESNNTAIHAALRSRPEKRHVVTSQVEHSSVLNYCQALEKEGYEITYLPVDREGMIKLSDLETAITPNTAIVSIMWANNETGVLFPVKAIAEICSAKGVLFHCDAVQIAGKLEINLRQTPVDYLSLAGHKFCAPKGIGILYVNRKAPFSPYLHGGHQERGRRGGTENVALIVGIGTAAHIALQNLNSYVNEVSLMRDNLEHGILLELPNTVINGSRDRRVANTSNMSFPRVESRGLLLLLDHEGICASAGSACFADSDEPSHVISAMWSREEARSAIRFSLCQKNTNLEVQQSIKTISRCVKAAHQFSGDNDLLQ